MTLLVEMRPQVDSGGGSQATTYRIEGCDYNGSPHCIHFIVTPNQSRRALPITGHYVKFDGLSASRLIPGVHSAIQRCHHINSLTSQRSGQPVLSRILVEVELNHSGAKRQPRGMDTLIVGLLLSRNVGIDLHLVCVVEGESGIDLGQREGRTIRSYLLGRESLVAFDRDGTHANARSGDDGPITAQSGVARNQGTNPGKINGHIVYSVAPNRNPLQMPYALAKPSTAPPATISDPPIHIAADGAWLNTSHEIACATTKNITT